MNRLLAWAIVIALAMSGAAWAQDIPREQTLIIGKVSSNPKKQFPRLEALATHLATRLKDQGIERGSAIIAQSNAEMIALLKDGKVDLVTETPLSALLMGEKTGAEIFLREWKGGAATYQSLFFTVKDGPVNSLQDLKGRKVVFQDPGSTSGFLLPLSMLRKAGLTAVELASPRESPPADKIGYVFANAEVNILAWVANGLVDAGVLSNLEMQGFRESHGPVVEKTRVFAESPPFMRSVLLARPGFDPKMKDAVKAVLLSLPETEEGKAVLEAYFDTARFEEVTPDLSAEFDQALEAYGLIRDRLEQPAF